MIHQTIRLSAVVNALHYRHSRIKIDKIYHAYAGKPEFNDVCAAVSLGMKLAFSCECAPLGGAVAKNV